MATYRNKNFSWQSLSFLQNGDVLDNCNCSQGALTEVSQDLTINNSNMFNCNLTGNVTGTFANAKRELCYHLNLDPQVGNFKNIPVEPDDCPHVVETIEIDNGDPSYVREETI